LNTSVIRSRQHENFFHRLASLMKNHAAYWAIRQAPRILDFKVFIPILTENF
jgi:hypothetical protein